MNLLVTIPTLTIGLTSAIVYLLCRVQPRSHVTREPRQVPTVYICDECVGLCNDIMAEEQHRDGQPGGSDAG